MDKLNYNCFRDILLYIELNKPHFKPILANTIILPNYTEEEILYTIKMLGQANFIEITNHEYSKDNKYNAIIRDITILGHNFINDTIEPESWSFALENAGKLESVSLPILQALAKKWVTTKLDI